uniref:Nuclease HARBI1 n=1 Tax=Lactuca sativa TaxID=4236 RepID=A0A9R1XFG9_LACSA|nr:hypothetical protein LSAT_V11C400222720 [Lactuca sativa]
MGWCFDTTRPRHDTTRLPPLIWSPQTEVTHNISKYPARAWEKEKMMKVIKACVILHNMIIKVDGRAICTYTPNDMLNPPANSETHHNLRQALTKHIWQRQFKEENEGDEDVDDEDNDADECKIPKPNNIELSVGFGEPNDIVYKLGVKNGLNGNIWAPFENKL